MSLNFTSWKRPQCIHLIQFLSKGTHPRQFSLNTSCDGELITARSSHQPTALRANKNSKLLTAFRVPGTLLEHEGRILQYVESKSASLHLLATRSALYSWEQHRSCLYSLHFLTAPQAPGDSYRGSPLTVLFPVFSICSRIAFLRWDSFFLLTSFCFKMQIWEGITVSLICGFPSITPSWGKGSFDLGKGVGRVLRTETTGSMVQVWAQAWRGCWCRTSGQARSSTGILSS